MSVCLLTLTTIYITVSTQWIILHFFFLVYRRWKQSPTHMYIDRKSSTFLFHIFRKWFAKWWMANMWSVIFFNYSQLTGIHSTKPYLHNRDKFVTIHHINHSSISVICAHNYFCLIVRKYFVHLETEYHLIVL